MDTRLQIKQKARRAVGDAKWLKWQKLLKHKSQLAGALRALKVDSSQPMEPMWQDIIKKIHIITGEILWKMAYKTWQKTCHNTDCQWHSMLNTTVKLKLVTKAKAKQYNTLYNWTWYTWWQKYDLLHSQGPPLVDSGHWLN